MPRRKSQGIERFLQLTTELNEAAKLKVKVQKSIIYPYTSTKQLLF